MLINVGSYSRGKVAKGLSAEVVYVWHGLNDVSIPWKPKAIDVQERKYCHKCDRLALSFLTIRIHVNGTIYKPFRKRLWSRPALQNSKNNEILCFLATSYDEYETEKWEKLKCKTGLHMSPLLQLYLPFSSTAKKQKLSMNQLNTVTLTTNSGYQTILRAIFCIISLHFLQCLPERANYQGIEIADKWARQGFLSQLAREIFELALEPSSVNVVTKNVKCVILYELGLRGVL